jgi:MtaA/CmuA family methyltransferase
MNSQQRHDALFAGRTPDRVPVYPILMTFAAREIGRKYSEFARDYRVLVEGNLTCMERYGFDAVSVISDPWRETAAFGAKVDFPTDDVPMCTDQFVTGWDELKKLPDADLTGNSRARDRIEGVAAFKRALGNAVPIIGWIEGPLAEAVDLAGMTNLLMKLMIEPAFAEALMDKCLVTAEAFARLQIEAGANIMGVGDAAASQVSPDLYARMVMPRQKRLFDAIHAMGAKVKLHICGNITRHLSAMAQTGADIIDFDYMVPVEHARASVGQESILCGNIDPVGGVLNSTPERVRDECLKLLSRQRGQRFILSAGCEIPAATPPENLKALCDAVRG